MAIPRNEIIGRGAEVVALDHRRPMEIRVSELRNAVETLERNMQEIAARLEMIMTPPNPRPDPLSGKRDSAGFELGNDLAAIEDRLMVLNDDAMSILERLAI